MHFVENEDLVSSEFDNARNDHEMYEYEPADDMKALSICAIDTNKNTDDEKWAIVLRTPYKNVGVDTQAQCNTLSRHSFEKLVTIQV